MCNELVITNRLLCFGDFSERITKICALKPYGIILREKDLDEFSYEKLARQVLALCKDQDVSCILHQFTSVAKRLSCKKIHLSFGYFKDLSFQEKTFFSTIGVSCHSLEEILYAEKNGATYVTFSPVFKTTCKPHGAPQGLAALERVCQCSTIPIFAL